MYLGAIYLDEGNQEKALSYCFESLNFYKKIKDDNAIAYALSRIGTIYLYGGEDYKKALDYYFQSLNIAKKLEIKYLIAYCYHNIGDINLRQKEKEKALDYTLKALKIFKDIGAKQNISFTSMLIGKVQSANGKYLIAKKYLGKALLLSKKLRIVHLIRDIAQEMSKVERELGHYQEAYKLYVLFKHMSDSLKNGEHIKKIAQLESEHKFQQEKDSIQFTNTQEKLALKRDIERRKIIQFSTFTGLGLLSILLLVLFLFFQSKLKSNKTLAEKSLEILVRNEEINQQSEEIKLLNKALEDSLDSATKDILLKNQKLSEYAFINSHETRAPIASLLGLISILKTDNIDSDTNYILQNIKKSAEELDQLTKKMNQILENGDFFGDK